MAEFVSYADNLQQQAAAISPHVSEDWVRLKLESAAHDPEIRLAWDTRNINPADASRDLAYEQHTPSDAVSSVADAIRASHRLAPLTEQQKLTRRITQEIAREEREWREEQRRAERERQQQEQEAIARHEAAAALAEQNRKARIERQERIDKEVHRRELNDLHFQSAQQRAWQDNVTSSFRPTLAYKQRQATLAEIDEIINPPAPPPEPDVIIVEQPTENTGRLPKLDYPKLRSWYFD
jgi:hypothetical protein